MKIKFCGADKEVTGSCHLLETNNKKILIDCGMFQGTDFSEGKNFDHFPFDPKQIDFVLLTHAHLDHCGRIPKLVKEGFSGKIYTTKASKELAPLIWKDAYNIMKYDNKKFSYPILYDLTDIKNAKSLLTGIDYDKKIKLAPDLEIEFQDAGHIFGSAFVSIFTENKKIVFSGDIGNENVPIIKETEKLIEADYLVCESTYGDRFHEKSEERKDIILRLIKDGVQKGGTIMIPAFSLERTQEFLYELNRLSEHEKTLPKIPIYLDSPLSIDATKVYNKYPEYYDEEAKKLHMIGDDFLHFPNLELTYTKRDSKKINKIKGPKMVIAGAGMMNGGRILHHAARYLSDPNSTLIIVGYQAQGTLGRKLYEGEKEVNVMHQKIEVKCQIQAIGALSAHGDQNKILNWIGNSKNSLQTIFFVHGEDKALTTLAEKTTKDFKIKTIIPSEGEEFEI
ncbi:MAG: MBL fold metallo-hydrolase [Patescibacteria group bacterium]